MCVEEWTDFGIHLIFWNIPNSVFSHPSDVTKSENLRIKVGSSYINYSMSVRNLGLILDNTLGMKKQVNYICKFCYYLTRII